MIIGERKKFFSWLFVSLFLFLVDSFGGFFWLHQLFFRLTSPWREMIVKRTASPPSPFVWEERRLALCQAKVKELEEENQAARRLLGAGLPPEMKFLPAKLLGRGKEEVFLNVGRQEGIKEGAAVVVENFLLGKVVKLNDFSSQVRLLSARGTRLLVGVWREEREWREGKPPLVKGILKGGEPLVLEEVLSQEEINKGDLVVSLEEGGVFLIGRISRVWETEDSLFKKAAVDWLIKPAEVMTVFVVR